MLLALPGEVPSAHESAGLAGFQRQSVQTALITSASYQGCDLGQCCVRSSLRDSLRATLHSFLGHPELLII
jgi:hypothetical protein